MRGAAVEGHALDPAMGGLQDRPARRLVDAPRFHADETVLDEIEPADPVPSADLVQALEQRGGREMFAINRDGVAALEGDFEIFGLIGREFRGDGAAEHELFRLDPRIFEHLALGGDVQQIGVDRKRGLAALVPGDRDLVLFGVFEKPGARGQVPFAPWRDDLDVGIERIIAELETDLVVALAGRAVSDGIGPDLAGDLDLAFGDQRPRNRGAEKIGAFVERVGAKHREHEIADELLAQIVDEDLADAEHLGLPARRLQLLPLAQIGGEGDDLAAIGFLQPAQDHRRVEPSRIGQHHLFHRFAHPTTSVPQDLGSYRPKRSMVSRAVIPR